MRILFIFICLTTLGVFGQDAPASRNREFYLTLADFSPVNIHFKYKHQVGERTYLKFGLVNLSGSGSELTFGSSYNFPKTNLNLSGGLEIGLEFRKQLTEKFALFHGPNLRYTYRYIATKSSSQSMLNPNTRVDEHIASIPYTVGVLYSINSNLMLSAELNPAISFNHTENTNENSSYFSNGFNFSLGNMGGLISLALRF